eukprot:gene20522-biopygen11603
MRVRTNTPARARAPPRRVAFRLGIAETAGLCARAAGFCKCRGADPEPPSSPPLACDPPSSRRYRGWRATR